MQDKVDNDIYIRLSFSVTIPLRRVGRWDQRRLIVNKGTKDQGVHTVGWVAHKGTHQIADFVYMFSGTSVFLIFVP